MVEMIVRGVIIGALASILSWLVVKRIQEKRESESRLEELDNLILGGGEWFETGIIEVLEEHDEELEKMAESIEEVEKSSERLKEKINELEARIDLLIERSRERSEKLDGDEDAE